MNFENNNKLLKSILNNKVIRTIIFQSVKLIHLELSVKGYSFSRLQQLPLKLSDYNYFDLFKKSIESKSKSNIKNILVYFIQRGRFHYLDYLLVELNLNLTDYILPSKIFSFAAFYGKIDIFLYLFKYLINNGIDITNREIYRAALSVSPERGDLEVVQWLALQIGNSFKDSYIDCCFSAVRANKLDILEWLLNNNIQLIKLPALRNICQEALENASFDIANWLLHNDLLEDQQIDINRLVNYRNLDTIVWSQRYIKQDRIYCTVSAMDLASRLGCLDIVQWLHFNRTEGCSSYCQYYAIIKNHFDVYEFLNNNRTEGFPDFTIEHLAREGNIDMIRYMHENRTEQQYWNYRVMDFAAESGKYQIFKFLHVNRTEGCSSQALRSIIRKGSKLMIEYVLEHQLVTVNENHILDAILEYSEIADMLYNHPHTKKSNITPQQVISIAHNNTISNKKVTQYFKDRNLL